MSLVRDWEAKLLGIARLDSPGALPTWPLRPTLSALLQRPKPRSVSRVELSSLAAAPPHCSPGWPRSRSSQIGSLGSQASNHALYASALHALRDGCAGVQPCLMKQSESWA